VKVFVSHAQRNADSPELAGLIRDLNRLSTSVWIDQDLTGGQPWWDQILEEIRACDVFIFVVTNESIQSKPCEAEVNWAIANKRPILPIKITEVPEWRVREPVASSQIIDYTRRGAAGDAAIDCLLALRGAIDRFSSRAIEPPPDPAPPAPDVPFSTLRRLQPFLDAGDLPLTNQEEFMRQVRIHRDDVDSDRLSLIEVLNQFRSRPDTAYSVVIEIDGMLAELTKELEVVVKDTQAQSRTAENRPPTETREEEPAHTQHNSEAAHDSPVGAGAKSKLSRLRAPDIDVSALAGSLVSWYETQNLQAQSGRDGARFTVQARSNKWASRIGAGVALTVVLWADGDDLAVEIGGAKWMDKAAAGAVAWFVLWPAIIPAAIGGVKQATLPTQTLRYIERMIPVFSARR
jgi:serine/threonine kinase PknH